MKLAKTPRGERAAGGGSSELGSLEGDGKVPEYAELGYYKSRIVNKCSAK